MCLSVGSALECGYSMLDQHSADLHLLDVHSYNHSRASTMYVLSTLLMTAMLLAIGSSIPSSENPGLISRPQNSDCADCGTNHID